MKSKIASKITSKNKNVINIKINTEKKSKNKKRKQTNQSGSSKGRSNYNSGYSVMPPIIINPATPTMMLPQYNQQPQQINYATREPQPIQSVSQIPQSVAVTTAPDPQPVPVSVAPEPAFINPTNTIPVPIAQTIKKKRERKRATVNNEFINPPSTNQVSFAQAIEEERDDDDWFSSPLTLKEKFKPTPNLDTIHKYYSDYETDNDKSRTNPLYPAVSETTHKYYNGYETDNDPAITSIKDASFFPEEIPEESGNIVLRKKKEHSDVVNAIYHSVVDAFDRFNEDHRHKYNSLLREYEQLNPDGKRDADLDGKPPTKARYKILQSRLKRLHAQASGKMGQISPEY